MKVKVVLLLYICCLQLLHQQQSSILVKGESIQNATSSEANASPKNGTNISTITNYQIKNTPNLAKIQLQEIINGTTDNNGSGEKLSRKITETQNVPTTPIKTQNDNKANASLSENKTITTKLTKVAPNLAIDLNALKSNGTMVAVKLRKTNGNETANIKQQVIMPKNADVNSTISSNAVNNIKKTISSPAAKTDHSVPASNNTLDVKSTNITVKNQTSATTTTTNTTTVTNATSTTTTTTTTTTTPKPKKPSITLGLGDFPHLPGEPIPTQKSTNSKLPTSHDNIAPPPNAQPSQELNSGFNYHRSRDFIVPIMTVLFTIPLVCGVVITTYRRFRDCWSTRHYRRMDFLVDGMYND